MSEGKPCNRTSVTRWEKLGALWTRAQEDAYQGLLRKAFSFTKRQNNNKMIASLWAVTCLADQHWPRASPTVAAIVKPLMDGLRVQ